MYEGINIYTSLEDEGEIGKGADEPDGREEKSEEENAEQSRNAEKKLGPKPS